MDPIVRQRIGLLRPLLKDASPEVRTTAAESIERLEGVSSIEQILHTLKTGDMGGRISAIYALGKIGGEKAVVPLVYCAGRPEADIRAAAVEVLGNLAVPATLTVVLERLKDDNPAIQTRALTALGRFSSEKEILEQVRPFLASADGAREAEAAITLARLGDCSSAETIAGLLSSPHASTRQAAALALSLLPLQ